jgi:predicted dehydrogenase
MNRRQFLKNAIGTVGVLSFPTIVPSSVLGRNGTIPPSSRINMGCIGLGGQGTFNMQAFLNKKEVQIVALCDVNKGSDDYDFLYQFPGSRTAGLARAKQMVTDYYASNTPSGSYNGCETYTDFRELLARDDIDAVTVCTPDHWHGLISIAAAKAGKDIYCEKPLVNTVAEGRAVCEAVNRYSRILQTGSHERSNHSVSYACELIRNGRIGKLHSIYVNMPIDSHQPIPPQPIMPAPENLDYDMWLGPTPWVPFTKKRTHFWWRYILEYGGGEMTDRGAHIIDLAQLGNETDDSGPYEISGKGEAPRDGLFNTFMKFDFQCRYANGVNMIGACEQPRGLRFVGTEGWIFIHIHGGRLEAHPESLLRSVILPEEIHLRRSPGHHQDFLNSIKSRQQPIASAEIGHRTATICHLINIAMLTEQKLNWDVSKEQIMNSPEAHRLLKKPMRAPWTIN